MDCPNGCHYPLEVTCEGEWDEHLHCGDCGANWSWGEASVYGDKRRALKAEMTTPCPWYGTHQFHATLAWEYQRCLCGKVVMTDCSPLRGVA
jgi:hypothetical protein